MLQPYAASSTKQATQVVRLVVVGMFRCGKTRFIEAISQYTEWQSTPERSWYFGRVRVDHSLILHFLEPPIERKFDYMWLRDVVRRINANGYIIMVDSSKPQTFPEFVSILYTVRGYHPETPIVVAANKQDKPGAWSERDIQLGLGLRDIKVMPCVATDRSSVKNIVIEVLRMSIRE